jgi:hypothetical protein
MQLFAAIAIHIINVLIRLGDVMLAWSVAIDSVDIGALRWHLSQRSMALPAAALLGRFLP